MAKFSKKIAKRIFTLLEEDSYTIAEICLKVGISERCYYNWQETNAEFAEGIKDSRDKFVNKKLVECEKSLNKLIRGYDYEERKTLLDKDKEGKPVIVEQTVTKKHVAPNLGAIIHFQTNKDPQNWKNRQNTELTGKDGKDLYSKVTDEDLDKRIAEIERKLSK